MQATRRVWRVTQDLSIDWSGNSRGRHAQNDRRRTGAEQRLAGHSGPGMTARYVRGAQSLGGGVVLKPMLNVSRNKAQIRNTTQADVNVMPLTI